MKATYRCCSCRRKKRRLKDFSALLLVFGRMLFIVVELVRLKKLI